MNKSMLTGAVLGAVVVTAGGVGALALKQGGAGVSEPIYAEIVQVQPVVETVRTPREQCYDEVVTHQNQPKDEHKVAGTAIGAIVGGVIGNQIGGGNGKKVATVAGAVAGGYAGQKVQGEMQARNTYQTTEQRCETKYDVSQKNLGFDVTYRFEDANYTVRMDQKPLEARVQVDAEGNLLPPAEG